MRNPTRDSTPRHGATARACAQGAAAPVGLCTNAARAAPMAAAVPTRGSGTHGPHTVSRRNALVAGTALTRLCEDPPRSMSAASHRPIGFAACATTMTLATLLAGVPLAPASAAPYTWGGTASINWNTAGNWSPGVVPTGSDTVTIPSGKLFAPSISGGNADSASGVAVNSGTTLTVTGSGSSLTVGTTGLSGTGTVSTQSSGALTLNGATNTIGTLTDGGSVSVGAHTLTVSTALSGAGSLSVASGGTVTLGGATNSIGTLNAGGTVTVGAHTLTVGSALSGAGTLSVASGGTVTLSAATNAIGTLTTSGSTALGANKVTVATDYNNTNFGSGNSFNKHKNVTLTSGAINASAGTAQTVSGTAVSSGTTTNPTLAFGNLHVGTSASQSYQVNAASGGATLRGAIQTTVNGGALTDTRLSGTGATAGTWTAAAGGNSSALNVKFTASTAGALTGQTVHLANNFDNVTEQTLSITGAAYNYAAATVNNTQPIGFGNVHVGDTVAPNAISITNSAASGSYSEKLDVSVSGTSGGVTSNGGSFTLLAAGSTNNSAITVGIDTSSAGSKSGNLTLKLTSDGSGTSGLGTTALTSQTVAVTGAAYNYAAATVNNAQPLVFGNYHVGDTVAQQALSISNTAPAGSFTEKLDATVGNATGGVTTNGGSFSLLSAGSTDSSSIKVGIDTSTAGDKSGTVSVALTSDGTGTSGLGNTALASKTVSVGGAAYDYAAATVNNAQPIDFSVVHVGDTVPLQALSVTNSATASGYAESLNANVAGTTGGVTTNNGSISRLAAGATDGSSIAVGIDTSTAGDKSGNVTLGLASDGTGTSGLGTTTLASQTVQVAGQVNNYAAAGINQTGGVGTLATTPGGYTLDLGTVQLGSATQTALLNVQNIAQVLADTLTGVFYVDSGNGLFALNGFDTTIDGLGAGDTWDGLSVALDPTQIGLLTEVLDFQWYGYNASGYQDPTIHDLYVTINASVVPEPGALAVLLSGLAGLCFVAPRRRNRRAS